jgi:hypothetical protein
VKLRNLIALALTGLALSGCGMAGSRDAQSEGPGGRACLLYAKSAVGVKLAVPSGSDPDTFLNEVSAQISDGQSSINLYPYLSEDETTLGLSGAHEELGTVSLTVRYRGLVGKVSNIELLSDGCHVIPVSFEGEILGSQIRLTQTN